MRFVRRADSEPSINLTPLIDVVFILLIFFMVSSRFVNEKDLALELPAASAAATAAPEHALTVSVAAGGGYRIEGHAVAADRLVASLQSLRAQYPRRTLRVRADGNARHGSVVRAMDAAAAAGFDRVDIATRTGEQGP